MIKRRVPREEEPAPSRLRIARWTTDPLTVRLATGVALLVIVPLGVGFRALANRHVSQTLETQRQAAEVQGQILELALLHQMVDKDPELLASILDEIGGKPSVRGAMILNHEGEIRFASDSTLVGQIVAQDSPSCIVCHQNERAERENWAVYGEGDDEVLRTVVPIENRRRCHSCHSPETRINGILILDTPLAELRAGLRDERLYFVGGAALLGLLLVSGIGLFVRRLVLVRLGRLGETARAIAAGGLEERAATDGKDVITWLAHDFNHMADTVSALVAEVRDQEAKLISIMDSLDDGLVVLDVDSRVVAANRAFCQRVGSHPDAMRDHRCHESIGLLLPCCSSETECPAKRCATTACAQRAVYSSTSEDGDHDIVEEVHASPVYDEDGNVVQVVEIWRDISERVEEEKRLAEIEHLVSLGTLASGFSHEVNTPLASVLTCAESAISQIDELEGVERAAEVLSGVRECALIIRDQVLRCRRITDQFLRFSRGIPPSIEPIDLLQTVHGVVSLVQATARENGVSVEVRGVTELPGVRANAEVVQQALLNVLVNAIQSCTGNPGSIVLDFTVDENAVHVRIQDDGCGIAPENRSGLFHPFQSSKPGGTGLGLFLSRSFLRRFGGDLHLVHSAPGEGSCFEVTFNRAMEEDS